MSQRTWGLVENLDKIDKTDYTEFVTPVQVSSYDGANLVCSRTDGWGEKHLPCIDIDLPCRLVESRTPGHFHLYIEKEIGWPEYAALLLALKNTGIVEAGYYEASLRHGATFLRKETACISST